MATNIRGKNRTSANQVYVYGNAARRLNAAQPVREPDRTEEIKRQQRKDAEHERIKKNRELQREHRANLVYTFVAAAIVVVMFVVCVQYLQLQANVKNSAREVARLEAQLTQMSVKNDETKMEIDGSIDYDNLLKVATEELGMVYPKRSQIVNYESGESEYVKQYQDVPSR